MRPEEFQIHCFIGYSKQHCEVHSTGISTLILHARKLKLRGVE